MRKAIDKIIEALMELKKELAENGQRDAMGNASEPSELLHIKLDKAYWEDAEVNGVRESADLDKCKMPGQRNGTIDWDIDPKTGRILNWPIGTTARTQYKIRDGFSYDYGRFHYGPAGVPDFMSPDDRCFGEYVHLSVGPEGVIRGWSEQAFLDAHLRFVAEYRQKYGDRLLL